MKNSLKELDLLYVDTENEQKKRRKLFFKTLEIKDDGRLNPRMTKEEFMAFKKDKPCKENRYDKPKGKRTIEIFFKFEPYHDVSYIYCFDDGCIYESRFYIGD